jgi:hypothetical protein
MIFVSEKERIGLRRRDDLMSCNSRPKAECPCRRQYQAAEKPGALERPLAQAAPGSSGQAACESQRHALNVPCYLPLLMARAADPKAAIVISASSLLVDQLQTLMRTAVRPLQVVVPHQQAPSSWIRSANRWVFSSSAAATRT